MPLCSVSRAQQNIKALTLASKMELFQKLQLKMGSATILPAKDTFCLTHQFYVTVQKVSKELSPKKETGNFGIFITNWRPPMGISIVFHRPFWGVSIGLYSVQLKNRRGIGISPPVWIFSLFPRFFLCFTCLEHS